jgi:ABC-type multidrug transport system fused ATPase/permease subunit
MSTIKQLWDLLDNKDKIFFFFIVLFTTLQVLMEMIGIAAAIPFVTALINPEQISEFLIKYNFTKTIEIQNIYKKDELLLIACIIFFSIFLIKNILIIITNKIISSFVYSFRTKLFSKLLNKVLNQEYIFFAKGNLTQIFNTLFYEVNNYANYVATPLITIFGELIIAVGIFLLIIILGNTNGILLTVPIIFLVLLILKKMNKNIKTWSQERILINEKIIKNNFEFFAGIKEIIIFGQLNKIYNIYKNLMKSLEKIDFKNKIIVSYPKILLEQAVILVFIMTIIILSKSNISNQSILVIVSFYLAAAYRFLPSINKISVSYQHLKQGKPSIPKIMNLYNLQLNDDNKIESFSNDKFIFKNKISFENINFGYTEQKKIIENLTLELKKGSIIGISGESGTGKSTLVNIISSLIFPEKGKIFLDDLELDNIQKIKKYRNLFCITSQDSFLLDTTIKENIMYGCDENFSQNRIDKALEFSNLNEMIKDLPDGLDTQLGLNIKTVSSGQKQRIALARSFYSNREILIYDEATNALDEENEKVIIKNIKKLKNKTIIMISHNKLNLDICDKIYSFKDNKLIENKQN